MNTTQYAPGCITSDSWAIFRADGGLMNRKEAEAVAEKLNSHARLTAQNAALIKDVEFIDRKYTELKAAVCKFRDSSTWDEQAGAYKALIDIVSDEPDLLARCTALLMADNAVGGELTQPIRAAITSAKDTQP